MKVAMVSEHASPLAVLGGADAGGQNVHVAALSAALARRGAEVVVHTRRDDVRLPRRVWARLGESRLFIDDLVENLGHAPVPHMIAYHVNPGFPVLDEGSEFISSARETEGIKPEWNAWRLASHCASTPSAAFPGSPAAPPSSPGTAPRRRTTPCPSRSLRPPPD